MIALKMTELFENAVGHERLGVLHALHDVVPFGFG
jgi:hypothetical protein